MRHGITFTALAAVLFLAVYAFGRWRMRVLERRQAAKDRRCERAIKNAASVCNVVAEQIERHERASKEAAG